MGNLNDGSLFIRIALEEIVGIFTYTLFKNTERLER